MVRHSALIGPRKIGQAEKRASHHPHSVRPADRCNRLTLLCFLPGIPRLDSELSQEDEPTSQRTHARVMNHDRGSEKIEVVRFGDGEPMSLHQRLQILLGGLLGVEANEVVHRRLFLK